MDYNSILNKKLYCNIWIEKIEIYFKRNLYVIKYRNYNTFVCIFFDSIYSCISFLSFLCQKVNIVICNLSINNCIA